MQGASPALPRQASNPGHNVMKTTALSSSDAGPSRVRQAHKSGVSGLAGPSTSRSSQHQRQTVASSAARVRHLLYRKYVIVANSQLATCSMIVSTRGNTPAMPLTLPVMRKGMCRTKLIIACLISTCKSSMVRSCSVSSHSGLHTQLCAFR